MLGCYCHAPMFIHRHVSSKNTTIYPSISPTITIPFIFLSCLSYLSDNPWEDAERGMRGVWCVESNYLFITEETAQVPPTAGKLRSNHLKYYLGLWKDQHIRAATLIWHLDPMVITSAWFQFKDMDMYCCNTVLSSKLKLKFLFQTFEHYAY